jgi:hypothetical protein
VAPTSEAAAEKPQDRLSRDFLGCSIFDFCNNIGTFRTSRNLQPTSEIPRQADIVTSAVVLTGKLLHRPHVWIPRRFSCRYQWHASRPSLQHSPPHRTLAATPRTVASADPFLGMRSGRTMRDETNFLNPFKVICPVQSSPRKYTSSRRPQISPTSQPVPARQEGRIAIVTDVGSECGGRGSARCA